ncbi:MAG: RNA pseudouridine synthase, partial [Clostridia bacterium]|nr:RNA pseudouridine synthase [Clostridia bacterium]
MSVTFASESFDIGKRIDVFVSEKTELTRSAVARLIESGAVFVGGQTVAKNYKIRQGDSVEVELPEPETSNAEPQDIPLDIIYEDTDIIV